MGWLRLSENPSTFSITLEINVRMRTGPGMAFTDDTLTPGRFGTEHARSKQPRLPRLKLFPSQKHNWIYTSGSIRKYFDVENVSYILTRIHSH